MFFYIVQVGEFKLNLGEWERLDDPVEFVGGDSPPPRRVESVLEELRG